MKNTLALTFLLVFAFILVGLFASSAVVDPINSCVLVYNTEISGSGAIIGPDCVLTAGHVADQPDLKIRTNDGGEYIVSRVEKDPDSDLARLYTRNSFDDKKPLSLDRTPLQVGDEITVIGYPFECPVCMFSGRVVGVDHILEINDNKYQNMDILDCHAGAGCSGGPVLDSRGYVRSVWVAYDTRVCINYAVPMEELDAGQ